MSRAASRALMLGVVALLGLSAHHFAFSSWNAIHRGIVDFPIFARHAEHFAQTGELYTHADNLAAYAPGTVVYKFPPTYAVFLLPLVRGGIPENMYYYHWAFLVVLYLAAVALAIRTLRPARAGPFVVGAALLALNFEPFFETLWRQQLEITLLALVTLCLWALLARRDLVAGAAVGLGAMLKVYPAFLLVYFAVRRRWKLIAACLGAALLLQALSLLVIGLHENQVYFFRILPAMLGESSKVQPENVALGRYLQEFGGLAPVAAGRLAQAIVLALLAAFFHATRGGTTRPVERDGAALELALFLALMLLWLPNAWISYQLLLLPLYLVLLGRCLAAERGRRAALLLPLLAGYACLLFYTPCAGPEMGWPCSETPRFLGLVRLPRELHDFMVQLRLLGTLLPAAAAFGLLYSERREGAPPAGSEA